MAKKHFPNFMKEDFSLQNLLDADELITKKVNGKTVHNLRYGAKSIWLFRDKNGDKRWGMEMVKEKTEEKVE